MRGEYPGRVARPSSRAGSPQPQTSSFSGPTQRHPWGYFQEAPHPSLICQRGESPSTARGRPCKPGRSPCAYLLAALAGRTGRGRAGASPPFKMKVEIRWNERRSNPLPPLEFLPANNRYVRTLPIGAGPSWMPSAYGTKSRDKREFLRFEMERKNGIEAW